MVQQFNIFHSHKDFQIFWLGTQMIYFDQYKIQFWQFISFPKYFSLKFVYGFHLQNYCWQAVIADNKRWIYKMEVQTIHFSKIQLLIIFIHLKIFYTTYSLLNALEISFKSDCIFYWLSFMIKSLLGLLKSQTKYTKPCFFILLRINQGTL